MRKAMVHVRWAFNFTVWNPTKTEWTFCNQCIQQEERERINRFYFRKDAKAAMIGRLLIRKVISENTAIPYKDLQLSRTEKGKPCVLSDKFPFDFNVSHQGDYAVIGAQTGSPVGTDVMKLEVPRSDVGKFFDTMNRQFSEEEWKVIKAPSTSMEQLKLFYRLWCLKESYVKALGVGIGFEIGRLNFNLSSFDLSPSKPLTHTTLKVDGHPENEWTFEEHLLDDHCIAIAYQKLPNNSVTEDETKVQEAFDEYKKKADREIEAANTKLEEMKAVNDRLVRERDQAEKDSKEKETKILNLGRELDKLRELYDKQKSSTTSLQREPDDLVYSKDDVGKNVHDLEKTKRQLEAMLEEQNQKIEELEDDLQITEDAKIRLEVNMHAMKNHHERDLMGKEEQNKSLLKQLREMKAELEDERKQKISAVNNRKKLEKEIKDLQQHQLTNESIKDQSESTFSILDYKTLIQSAMPMSEPEEKYWEDFSSKPDNPVLLKHSNKT